MVSVQAADPQSGRGEVGGGGGQGASPASDLPSLQHHIRSLEGEGEPTVGLDLPTEGAGVVIEDVLLHGGVDPGADVPPESAVYAAGA